MTTLYSFVKYLRNIHLWTILLLAAITLTTDAVAQTGNGGNSPAMEQANQLYFAKNWNAAAPAFEAITRTEPNNTVAWLRLGVSRHKQEQFAQALEAFKHAENDPQVGPSVLYREAASLFRLDRKDEAIASLNKAVDAGLIQTQVFLQDQDLTPLHEDAAFKKVLEKADTVAHPCAHQPEYRQFDFWIGEWDVVTTKGHNPAGSSSIQLILEQCVIFENWSGGGTGKSFNHFDTRTKKWIQDWIDSQSNGVHFEGGPVKSGVMSFFADSTDSQGAPIRRHMQFESLDKDRVRQFSEASSDGGKTWTPQYDFTYIRKK